tara:strand:- start:1529 stop:2710 length:1182 start_codon:yes stop_codon:yes gene_type:complete
MSNINLELLNPSKNWTIGIGRNNQLKEIRTIDQIILNKLDVSGIEISNNLVISSGMLFGPSDLIIDPLPHFNIGGQVTIKGNLLVEGTTTTVNSSSVDICDNIITLNKGDETSFSQESGIEIYLGNSPKPQLLFHNNDGDSSRSNQWQLKYDNANDNDNSFNNLKIKNLYSQNIINSHELNVSGHTTLQDVSAGATDISNGLVVNGNSIFKNNLDVEGDLSINGNFFIDNTELSTYLLEASSNQVVSSNTFTVNSRLTLTADLIDCSDILFQTITPTKNNKQILVSMDFNYLCSAAYDERINIQICRFRLSDSTITLLKQNNNLGPKNSAGEFIGNYSCSFLDSPVSNSLVKYFVKFRLENNNSEIPQGITNINTASGTTNSNGSSSISLIEF